MMKDIIKLCFIFLFNKIFSNISCKKSKKKFIDNNYLNLVSAKEIKNKKFFFEKYIFYDHNSGINPNNLSYNFKRIIFKKYFI